MSKIKNNNKFNEAKISYRCDHYRTIFKLLKKYPLGFIISRFNNINSEEHVQSQRAGYTLKRAVSINKPLTRKTNIAKMSMIKKYVPLNRRIRRNLIKRNTLRLRN